MFYPQPLQHPDVASLNSYALSITTPDNITLQGWLVKKEAALTQPLVVYYGGNAEEVSSLATQADIYTSAGTVLFMNYRGYGQSQGKPSQKALYQDALFVLDHISKTEKIPLHNIILLGRSLGSGIATYVASKRDIRSVILITAYDSILNVAKKQYPLFPISLLLRHPFDSLKLAPSIEKPLLNIMAEHDEVIANDHAKNLAQNWKGPVTDVIIAGSGHNTIDTFSEYWKVINTFISENSP